jgi:transposase
MSKQAYKFRLYPTKKQAQALQWTLERARELYNAALQERRDAYRMAGKSITYYDQANQLPEIKDIREEYKDIHSQVLQDVLRRVQKAFDHIAMIASAIRKLGTRSPLIIGCASPRLARSRSSCIARYRAR